MLIRKRKDNFKVTFIILAFALMLLVEPLLAEKAHDPTLRAVARRSSLGSRVTGDELRLTGQAAPQVQSARERENSKFETYPEQGRGIRNLKFPPKAGSVVSTQRSAGTTLSRMPASASFDAGRGSRLTLRPVLRSTAEGGPQGSFDTHGPSRQGKFEIPTEGGAEGPRSAAPQSKPFVITTPIRHGGPSSSLPKAGISSDKIQRPNTLIGERRTSIDIIRKVMPGNEQPADLRFHGDKLDPTKAHARREPKAEVGTSLPLQRDPAPSTMLRHAPSKVEGAGLRPPAVDKPGQKTAQTVWDHASRILRESKAISKEPAEKGVETSRDSKRINLSVVDRLLPSSRPRTLRSAIGGSGGARTELARPSLDVDEARNESRYPKNKARILGTLDENIYRRWRPVPSAPEKLHIHHHEHVYWDSYNRLCHRIVWPGYRFAVFYGYSPYFTFRYVYPYHFRRYIFVSLGGYWPIDYRYIRYYWYGCHPYRWYGYYPIAYEVKGDTYNYYTYNYYYDDDDDDVAAVSSQVVDGIKPVDHNTFADVREKLAQQKAEEPKLETLADTYFDEGVKAFEAGDYNIAIEKFAKAMELAPDDMVVPFAYSQVLFASGQYSEAVEVLRAALAKVSPEKEGVFYPRGLYSDDEILFEQIERLTKKAETFSFDAGLQLLLGYQLLGIGEIDKAIEPLQRASQDFENAAAATTLLDLLAKIRTDTK